MAHKILIVDDSPAMRSFIKRVLQLSGLEVSLCLEAGNGEEALELLRHEQVDVVLTDINMPVMNGMELIRNLAAHKILGAIPVLVISTDKTEGRVREMLAIGAHGYIAKPFQPEELRVEIERILEVAHAAH